MSAGTAPDGGWTRVEFAALLRARAEWATDGAVAEGGRENVIEESEPEGFMAAFVDAVEAGGPVFLADPGWGERERAQFAALLASGPARTAEANGEASRGWLCLPTGGSSGNVKLARHDQDTLAAAVRGFTTHFGVTQVNVVGLLPLHHVSGFVAWMRALLTGGKYVSWDWRALAEGRRPVLPGAVAGAPWFVSLVPTQLQRLLSDPAAVAWLRGFRAVFIGGGPSWPELVEEGARLGLPLAFSYGMSETAAMVTALRPEEFAQGGRGSGAALPHARVEVAADGTIAVEGASLFRGYYPETRAPGPWPTGDLGAFDERGSLRVLGRRDALIISGGKKVDPLEVEAVLRASGEFADVAVIGVPDAEWGQAVVACYPPEPAGGRTPDLGRVALALAAQLARYKAPKRYVAVAPWPRNEQGKVNRAVLVAAATVAGRPVIRPPGTE